MLVLNKLFGPFLRINPYRFCLYTTLNITLKHCIIINTRLCSRIRLYSNSNISVRQFSTNSNIGNMEGDVEDVVSFEQMKTLVNNCNVLVIDVREPHELQNTGQIEGSINIPGIFFIPTILIIGEIIYIIW